MRPARGIEEVRVMGPLDGHTQWQRLSLPVHMIDAIFYLLSWCCCLVVSSPGSGLRWCRYVLMSPERDRLFHVPVYVELLFGGVEFLVVSGPRSGLGWCCYGLTSPERDRLFRVPAYGRPIPVGTGAGFRARKGAACSACSFMVVRISLVLVRACEPGKAPFVPRARQW